MVFNGSGDIIETKLFREPKVIIKKSIPKYRGSLTSKSKTFDFVNLPKVLRSKEVCNNLQSNFDISDIPMVVYYLSPSIRSTFFNYKQFVLHLNIDEFLKDPNLIKCCCNKYDNSFINNHYVHIITGNLDIVNNERLCKLISKGPKHREPKKIVSRILVKKYELTLINSLREHQKTKASTRTIFQIGKVMLCHQ